MTPLHRAADSNENPAVITALPECRCGPQGAERGRHDALGLRQGQRGTQGFRRLLEVERCTFLIRYGPYNMNDNILYHALARPRAPRPDPPLSPRKQRVFRIGPGAVQGAKRRSEPLTARTDPPRSSARGKGVFPSLPAGINEDESDPPLLGGVALVLAIMRPLGRGRAFSNWLTTAE